MMTRPEAEASKANRLVLVTSSKTNFRDILSNPIYLSLIIGALPLTYCFPLAHTVQGGDLLQDAPSSQN